MSRCIYLSELLMNKLLNQLLRLELSLDKVPHYKEEEIRIIEGKTENDYLNQKRGTAIKVC